MAWLTVAFGLASGNGIAGCARSGAAARSANTDASVRIFMNPSWIVYSNSQSSVEGALNRSIESILRFVNLTASGLLAGSLGFGEKALVPGWREELPTHRDRWSPMQALRNVDYFNAIGPLALGTAVTLAVGARDTQPMKRALDTATALGLAGVLAATIM